MNKSLIAVCVVFLFLTNPPGISFAEEKNEIIIVGNNNNNPVVRITDNKEEPIGSGFIVHPQGYILTAAHVVHLEHENRRVIVYDSQGSPKSPAKIELIAIDEHLDLALLKFAGKKLKTVSVGDSNSITSENVLIGVGFKYKDISENFPEGKVTNFHQSKGSWEAWSATLRGMSGGPVFDKKTKKVVAMINGGTLNQPEIKYMTPINHANNLLSLVGIPVDREDIDFLKAKIKVLLDEKEFTAKRLSNLDEEITVVQTSLIEIGGNIEDLPKNKKNIVMLKKIHTAINLTKCNISKQLKNLVLIKHIQGVQVHDKATTKHGSVTIPALKDLCESNPFYVKDRYK